MQKIIRVLVAKPGLDGHDRGAKVVARGLRDAGFEVIYTGLHQTPEMVVNAALQEDVDIIGLSILSGAHVPLVEAIQKLMKKTGLKKPIFVGGIIPDDDARHLKKGGVAAVFGPGTPLQSIADEVRDVVERAEQRDPRKQSKVRNQKAPTKKARTVAKTTKKKSKR